jgi:hypothetical protein
LTVSMDSTIRFVQVCTRRWARVPARRHVSLLLTIRLERTMTRMSKSDMYSQDVALEMPVLDPVATGVGAEQDNHQHGRAFVENDLLDALELFALGLRQMGQRLLHGEALSALHPARKSEKRQRQERRFTGSPNRKDEKEIGEESRKKRKKKRGGIQREGKRVSLSPRLSRRLLLLPCRWPEAANLPRTTAPGVPSLRQVTNSLPRVLYTSC